MCVVQDKGGKNVKLVLLLCARVLVCFKLNFTYLECQVVQVCTIAGKQCTLLIVQMVIYKLSAGELHSKCCPEYGMRKRSSELFLCLGIQWWCYHLVDVKCYTFSGQIESVHGVQATPPLRYVGHYPTSIFMILVLRFHVGTFCILSDFRR